MANKYGETRMKTNLKWGDNVTTTQKAINKNIFSEHRRGIYLGGIKYSLSKLHKNIILLSGKN